MGQAISYVRENLTDDDDKSKKEEQLRLLEKMVKGHMQAKKQEIINGERNDQEINVGYIVAYHEKVNIKMSIGMEGSDDSIGTAIHDFFSGDFIDGLEKIIEVGASTILGNTSIGEYENSDMFLVWDDNALIRCDAYYYRWNFASKGVIQDVEGAVGVLLLKRVIDIEKVDPQVLTYTISNMANRTGQDQSTMIDQAMNTLQKAIEFQVRLKQLQAGTNTAAE